MRRGVLTTILALAIGLTASIAAAALTRSAVAPAPALSRAPDPLPLAARAQPPAPGTALLVTGSLGGLAILGRRREPAAPQRSALA